MPKPDENAIADVIGLSGEPWVHIPGAGDLADWGHEQSVAFNQISRQRPKMDFYTQAFDFLTGNDIHGDYHEYGCHRARTFRMALTAARRQGIEDMRFFAFDSFEGLPAPVEKPANPHWQAGSLRTGEDEFRDIIQAHGLYLDRVETIPGFYDRSLTGELQRRLQHTAGKIALATIDCDLYESAVPVFRFIEPLLQEGSLLYIDDLFNGYKGSPCKGVARAFREFRKTSRFRFIRHVDVGWWGRAYIAYLPDENAPAPHEEDLL